MLSCQNNFIEEFATMLEDSENWDENKIAEKTLSLMLMLSNDPSLFPVMKIIRSKLKSLVNEEGIAMMDNKQARDSNKFVADQLRELKIYSH